MSQNPFDTPKVALDDTPHVRADARTKEIALRQRNLLFAVLFGVLASVVPVLQLLAIPVQIYCVYRLAKALDFGTGALIAICILQFIPLVSLVTLLVVNGRANTELKDAGLKVGLLGVPKADIDRL